MTLDRLLGEDGFAGLGSKAAENLEALGQSLRNCPNPTVKTYEFCTKCVKADLKKIEVTKDPSIYIFELSTPVTSEMIDAVRKSYDVAASKKERKLARKNCEHSQYLYVGSTTRSSLRSRIGQHLGFGNKATYALHLSYWGCPSFNVRLTVANYEGAEPRVIQELEDHLWTLARPMFGRKGRR